MKKVTICILVLITLLILSGCNLWTVGARLDAFVEAADHRIDAVEDAAEAAVGKIILPESVPSQTHPPKDTPAVPALTKEEAEAIALEYAGLTADQVSYLRTEYEIDDRVPQYDVQFQEGRWEYEFEIHAGTGTILSYDRDD